MKTLYLIRHAKSSWDFDLEDHERPLNERGQNDANLIGAELKVKIENIDKIICSSAVRALSTAKIILKHLDIDDSEMEIMDALYDFEGNQVVEVIKNCDDRINQLMLFGHNHAFTSLSNLLGTARIDNLPTAGVVKIEFDIQHWRQISEGKTKEVLYPKLFK